MQIFDGFRPGMTSIEAKMKHGEPDEIGSNSLGPYYAYKRAGGEVFVAWEEHRSGGDGFKVWTLRAYPKPGNPKRFLHSSVLKHLDPGAEQALARFGPPSRKGEGPYGSYWIYKVSAGEVQVSHEEQGSPPGPYTKWWILRGYPANRSVSDVFVPEAAGHIPADLKGIEVVIMGSDNIPVLRAQVEAGQVVEMTWRR